MCRIFKQILKIHGYLTGELYNLIFWMVYWSLTSSNKGNQFGEEEMISFEL